MFDSIREGNKIIAFNEFRNNNQYKEIEGFLIGKTN